MIVLTNVEYYFTVSSTESTAAAASVVIFSVLTCAIVLTDAAFTVVNLCLTVGFSKIWLTSAAVGIDVVDTFSTILAWHLYTWI